MVRRFWFDRWDARGPHVFALFRVEPEEVDSTAAALASRLTELLAAHPSTEELSPQRLARLDAEIRGRRQCEPDGRPGIAANNSFEIFEHPPRGYPFSLSAGLPEEEQLWDLATDLSFWAIDRLAARPGSPAMAAALRWTASVDRELRLAGLRPAEYWHYHAATIVPALSAGVGAKEEAAALSALAAGVGAANPAFGQAWEEIAAKGPVWPGISRLVAQVLGDVPGRSPWSLLREINHITLKQLGLPVALHLPLVLYAWRRSAG